MIFGTGNVANLPQAGDTEIIAAGTLDVTTTVTGSGAFQIGHDALLQLDGSLSAGQTIQFSAVFELILNSPGTVLTNTITGLSVGDQIDLKLGSGVSITNVRQLGSVTTITTNVESYQLTNVSFAASSPTIWRWGTDSSNGDQFISLVPGVDNWLGASNTDLGTNGNWSNNLAPDGFTQATFASNPGTLTGTANVWAALYGTYGTASFGTWTLNNTLLSTNADGGPTSFSQSLGF